ncbi:MAG: LptF/LptG family permease [Alphaproteobacteria bacterium]
MTPHTPHHAKRRKPARSSPVLFSFLMRRTALSFIIVLATLSAIFFLINFADQLYDNSQPNLSFLPLLYIAFLPLPSLMETAMPIVMFLSILHTFIIMEHKGEITPLGTLGLSDTQILLAPATVAIIIGAASLAILNPLAASLIQKEAALAQGDNLSLQANAFNENFWLRETINNNSEILMHVENAENETLFHNITIVQTENGQIKEHITAHSARLLTGAWLLENAWRIKQGEQAVYVPRLHLSSQVTPRILQQRLEWPESTPLTRLPELIKLRNKIGAPSQLYQHRFHSLLAGPATLCTMVLLAAVFSLRPWRRQHRALWYFFTFGSLLSFYALVDVSRAISLNRELPIEIAVWCPILICILFSLAALNRNEHV